MSYAVCGLDCNICPYKGKTCKGCQEQAGKVFWAKEFGMPGCAIYLCAKEKGYNTCAPCPNRPCNIWLKQREPHLTDEEFAQSIQERMENLSEL